MKKWQIILFFFLSSLSVRAQTTKVKKAQASFEKAQAYLKSDNFDLAKKSLLEAVNSDSLFQYAYIQLGDINRRLKAFTEAKSAYNSAISLGSINDVRAFYGLGESELNTGDYTNALHHFTTFINAYKGNDKDFLSKTNKYIKDCAFSIEALKSPVLYQPINMGPEINSKYRDYFPAITADGRQLIFSRNIDNNEDFFQSEKEGEKWSVPIPLSTKINTPNFNEGAQSISPDGMYLFFTGCGRPDGIGRCDIYLSHKEGNTWGEPFNLGNKVNSEYWDSQPSISPDGSTLYFVSNRPGGFGSYDIWKSILQSDGYWSAAVNLGPQINTPYDEHTPFIHPDGKTLYFSSDGWPGLGNKDIFLSRINEKGQFGIPQNLGYPINTFNEETGLIVTPEGSEGLFSADLKGGYGDMDIYQFKMPEDKRPNPIAYVKGTIKDKETGAFLDAEVQIVNLKEGTIVYRDYTSSQNGAFLAVMPVGASYAFHVIADSYLLYSENYNLTATNGTKPFEVNIELLKIKTGGNVVLRNVFFNTNEFALLPESLTELNQLLALLKNNPKISIEIQGYTDNVGNDIDNKKLSLNRARSVYEYLIANKIDPAKLSYIGFGKQNPVANNQTEDGRKINRRTSFVITKI
ncbi:outer membrane protein OmpA-like peptidoglycan-associated protein [Pedobacter sp. UYP24]